VESRSIQFAIEACAGELLAGSPDAKLGRVCTDSRHAQAGDLFIALSGEKFDGHSFLTDVATKGVSAVMIARSQRHLAAGLPLAVAVIEVDDARQALGKLGARYRQDFSLPVVAVGGSNGKTTTKELIASVLRQKFDTLWSEASFNNDIGVPQTLLKLERRHGAAVFEVGTNHPGELAPLVGMIQPRIGVITSIGREHLEFFGDVNGVAQEEGWLAELLPADGALVLNGDSEWAVTLARRTKARVITVGFSESNAWRVNNFRVGEDGVTFEVVAPQSECSGEYRVRLLGRHQVPNALLALAAGWELGVNPEQLRQGLADCAAPKMRLQLWEAAGVRVLDDSYNANADSMLAALQTLHDLPCSGRRVAVLGDMAELGEHTEAAHREIGRRSAELGVNRLIAVGRWARITGEAALMAGLKDVTEFADVPGAAVAVKNLVQPGDVVLLKASRSTGLERIGEALKGWAGDQSSVERKAS
jgi:UDP-N-acetylmuramoyl-tripeptide--D-alanyl-D-alanine ligase